MVLKLIFGVAIVAFCTFCGYIFTRKYRRRKSFYVQLYEFNERFINEISYYRRPLMEFSSAFVYKGEFQECLQTFFHSMSSGIPFSSDALDKDIFYFINSEEKAFVQDYFQMLGKGDSVSQKAYFSSIKERLSKLQTEAVTAQKKYGELYIKLGFLCGLFILILML